MDIKKDKNKKMFKYKIVLNFDVDNKINKKTGKMMDFICKQIMEEFSGEHIKDVRCDLFRIFDAKMKGGLKVYFDAKDDIEADKIIEEMEYDKT
jgi:hypothetical protein